ncbi:Rieske (2Fe-2S) protein [Streptomyces sp. DSM 44938]|uniref:Cytochrome bc1 complex Rieske iron-sulfur subunit n=1 Tax=Streptomyces litchfieldiae TaxID=3075543 RepID=A0ABU2MRX0_9ACTN|nr:Rieske (2Fe-2S) protein [Streptomyces sp. DSM 44938]MDT0343844.1 Rieske (2Fe-2S) protein [Streptomyces sp. DSM 44938]
MTACGSGDGDGEREGGGQGERLAATSDIPAGGGKVFGDRRVVVVVVQPADGEFRAFSAVCTHRGCTVSEVRDGTIDCACHGSKFAIEDGGVVRGPATEPLPEERITVRGEFVHLA